MADQVLAKCPGTHRHHDVVDRSARCVLERFDVRKGHRTHRKTPIRGDRCVPRRRRCRAQRNTRARLVVVRVLGSARRRHERLDRVPSLARGCTHAVDARGLGQLADDLELETRRLDRVRGEVANRLLQQIAVLRDLLALPLDPLHSPFGVGCRIGHHLQHHHAGRTVDRRVVSLGQHRPSPIGEAFDHIDLPQRPSTVHVAPDDASNLLSELIGGAGRGQAEVTDVVVEVEVGVVDPVRMIEPKRNVDEASPHGFEVAGHHTEALVDVLERFEVLGRPLVDREAVHVAVRVRRLHVQETCIEPGQLFHDVPNLPRATARDQGHHMSRPDALFQSEPPATMVRCVQRRMTDSGPDGITG